MQKKGRDGKGGTQILSRTVCKTLGHTYQSDALFISVLCSSYGEGNGNPPSILAWRTPWTEEPGRPWSIGSQRVDTTEVTKHIRMLFLRYPCAFYFYYTSVSVLRKTSFFLAVLALSCDTWDHWSSLQHAWSLIVACGLKFPNQGLDLYPLPWECRVLATRPLRKYWKIDFD